MGLASSQGRLCMLTRRKADVESRLMRVSNAKMALARDSEKVSKEYTRALNATSLVYNMGNKDVPLTYGLIMSPATQCMLTNSAGQVVLDSSIWAALGSPAKGKAIGDEKTFIATMAKVDPNTIDVSKLGGAAPTIKPDGSGSTPSFETAYKDNDIFKYLAKNGTPMTDKFRAWDGDKNGSTVTYDGGAFCFSRLDNHNIDYDKKKAQIDPVTGLTMNYGMGTVRADLDNIVDQITGDATAAVLDTLKVQFTDSEWSSIKGSMNTAAVAAQDATKRFYDNKIAMGNLKILDAPTGSDNAQTKKWTTGTNDIVADYRGNDEFYIDPNQVVVTFLNYFDAACQKISSGQSDKATGEDLYNTTVIPSTSQKKSMDWDEGWTDVGDNDGYAELTLATTRRGKIGGTYGITPPAGTPPAAPPPETGVFTSTINGVPAGTSKTSATTAPSTTTDVTPSAAIQYYHNLYQAISSRGWVLDTDVTNQDYMQGMIQFGGYGVKKYENGNWTELSQNSPNSPISATTNDEAREKAKAAYDAAKDKIKAKEVEWDVEQNAADTERAAIIADMDSVKKIIDKCMDAFKLFMQG